MRGGWIQIEFQLMYMMTSLGMTLKVPWWSHPQYARDGDTLKTLVGMVK
jgi:hypothetical protein